MNIIHQTICLAAYVLLFFSAGLSLGADNQIAAAHISPENVQIIKELFEKYEIDWEMLWLNYPPQLDEFPADIVADAAEQDSTTYITYVSVKDGEEFLTVAPDPTLYDNSDIRDLLMKKTGGHLHAAVLGGSLCLVKELLKLNIPVNEPNEDGRTPLHLASHRGVAIVLSLIEHGANVHLKDKRDNTPRNLAESGDKWTIRRIITGRPQDV